MKKEFYELFDSISPDASVVDRTEKEINEMLFEKMNKRAMMRRTVCIALAACLMLAGAAFAAVSVSGILDRLYPNNEPSQHALETLVVNAASAQQNGITVNIDEYLIDQNSLHMGWTVSSQREKDIFYTTNYELVYTSAGDEALAENSIGGQYGGYSSAEAGDATLVHLDKGTPQFSGNMGYGYKSNPSSPIEAKLIVHAYETDYMPVNIDGSNIDLRYTDDPAVAALENAKQIGVDSERMTNISGYSAYNTALDKLMADGMDFDTACEAALTESGVFTEVASIELTVTIQPEQAAAPLFTLSGEQRFELSDATVFLKKLSVGTASTVVEYEVHTKKDFDESNIIGNGVTYILFDQDGNPLNEAYALGMDIQHLEDKAGKHVWHVNQSGNPLPETVTAITFVPTANLARQEGESSNAYFLRMRKQAEDGQCFTVAIR